MIHILGIALLREQDRLGNRDPEFCRDGIIEIFVVGRPPEGIVDDVAALQHGVLEVAAVIFHFVGNAVDDDAVFRGLVHSRAAQLHEFRGDAVASRPAFLPAR